MCLAEKLRLEDNKLRGPFVTVAQLLAFEGTITYVAHKFLKVERINDNAPWERVE